MKAVTWQAKPTVAVEDVPDPIALDSLFDKQITVRMGQANAPHLTQEILPLLLDDNAFDVDNFTTHRLPLGEALRAYEMFQKKEDEAIKIVFKPEL